MVLASGWLAAHRTNSRTYGESGARSITRARSDRTCLMVAAASPEAVLEGAVGLGKSSRLRGQLDLTVRRTLLQEISAELAIRSAPQRIPQTDPTGRAQGFRSELAAR